MEKTSGNRGLGWGCMALVFLFAGCGGRQSGSIPPAAARPSAGLRDASAPSGPPGIVLIPGLKGPALIASDGAGNEWVAADKPPMLARVNEASYDISKFILPSPNKAPIGVALGRHRTSMWYTRPSLNLIGYARLSTGAIHQYALPHRQSYPENITAGPDNAMWFTEEHRIGRIELAHFTISEYSVMPLGELIGIALGPDRALWFTDFYNSRIGRIDATTHSITEFALRYRACPDGIAAGNDGGVWFAETSCGDDVGRIGRIDPHSHAVAEWRVTTRSPGLSQVVARDSYMWFTEVYSNKIGRINTKTHAIREYALPGETNVLGLAHGADDQLWFTQADGDVGKLCPELDASECATSP